MIKFIAGFAIGLATALGTIYVCDKLGVIALDLERDEETVVTPLILESDAGVESTRSRRARGRARRGSRSTQASNGQRTPPMTNGGRSGNDEIGTAGDSLDEDRPAQINAGTSGGEARLSGAQIERGFDSVFPSLRRCLYLADGETTGVVRFGFRIEPSGSVSAVQLTGPRSFITGELGECFKTAARRARFESFDGASFLTWVPLTVD